MLNICTAYIFVKTVLSLQLLQISHLHDVLADV